MCGILSCTNAKVTLKTMKLTGCTRITGIGLEPLRGSTVLQQLDLSLVGYHENPILDPEPSISEAVVLPILHSIIDANGNSLKFIHHPVKWRCEASTELEQFLENYHQVMANRMLCCSKCDVVIQPNVEDDDRKWYCFDDGVSSWFGLQNYTCCICMKFICYGHDNEEGGPPLRFCSRCQRGYCTSCNPGLTKCDNCRTSFCKECGELSECEGCENNVCKFCFRTRECCNETRCNECNPFVECWKCGKAHCEDCFDGKDNDVCRCDDCGEVCCLDCRHLSSCSKDWENSCSGCDKLIAQFLTPKLKKENKELRRKIEQLENRLATNPK